MRGEKRRHGLACRGVAVLASSALLRESWSLTAGGSASRRSSARETARRALADDYRREEFSSEAESSDDAEFEGLYERVSAARELLALADRACVENWRRGAMDQTSLVRVKDGLVSQARLHGETCAFGTSKGLVVVVDLADGEVIDLYEGHEGEVTALDWDGTQLLTGGMDGIVRVFEPQQQQHGARWEVVDDRVADAAETRLNAAAAALAREIESEADAAALARAPLYRVLCKEFAREDVAGAYIRVDDDDEAIALRGHSSRVTGVRVVDGVVYSCSLDRQILAWDLDSREGRLVATTRSAVCCLCVAGNLAIVGLLDGSVAAYELDTGRLAFDLPRAHDGAVRALHVAAIDPWERDGLDGRLLVTGGMDGVVKIHSLERVDGALAPVKPRPHAAAPTTDYSERRRRDRVGAHALHGHAGAVVAVQADGTKLVSGATDGSVRVWSLRTGEPLYAILGLSRRLSSLHFDKHLFVCDGNDQDVVVLDFSDPRAGKRIRDLYDHPHDDDDDDDDDA